MKQQLLYEGKAKRVYESGAGENVVVEYKNTATAFNGEKKEDITGKGELNCAICSLLYAYLEENGVPTHFIKQLGPTEMLVKRVKIIPLEVITRNITAGSFSKKYGVPEGIVLKKPCFEFSYKDDSLGDPMINTSQALALELASYLCVINSPLPDGCGVALAIDVCQTTTTQVILLSSRAEERAESEGVLVLTKPFTAQAFTQATRLARAVHNRLARESNRLQTTIDDIKLIDRAKCLLIETMHFTEQQAHRHIEKQAMDMRITKKAVALNVLKTYEN